MYVQKNEKGDVVGVFANLQPGIAEEWVEGAELHKFPSTREEVDAQRLRAYADPIKGSDRLFVEAQRMQMMGEQGWELVRDRAAARYQEIQELYPWP